MTKKKIAAFGASALAALLIGFVLFAYYNFTHSFHIAISAQQASDIETALKGSLGDLEMVRHKRSSGLIWIDLLLSCVLDKHDITVLAASTEDQLFAIRRPVETDQGDSVEMCDLIQRAIAYSEAPDVVAVLPAIDVRQFAAIRVPTDACR